MTNDSAHGPDHSERRKNPRLREFVDEMLASIRVASNTDHWTPEERAKCQDDMNRIMANIRTELRLPPE